MGYVNSFENYWRILQADYNVVPGRYLLAVHGRDAAAPRRDTAAPHFLLVGAYVDYWPYLMTDAAGSMKIYTGAGVPPAGWNTNIDFDDSSWASLSTTHLQNQGALFQMMPSYISMFGSCARPYAELTLFIDYDS